VGKEIIPVMEIEGGEKKGTYGPCSEKKFLNPLSSQYADLDSEGGNAIQGKGGTLLKFS